LLAYLRRVINVRLLLLLLLLRCENFIIIIALEYIA